MAASYQTYSDKETNEWIKQYELKHAVKFVMKSSKNNYVNRITSLGNKLILVDDGRPFITLGIEMLECLFGSSSRQNSSMETMISDQDNDPSAVDGKCTTNSTNHNEANYCPAKLKLVRTITFPEYKTTKREDRDEQHQLVVNELKKNFSEDTIQQYRVYIYIIGKHEHHVQVEDIKNLDNALIDYIKTMPKHGIWDVGHVYKETCTYAHSLTNGQDLDGFCLNWETVTYHMNTAGLEENCVNKSAVNKKVKRTKPKLHRDTRPPVKPGETRPPVKPRETRPPVKPGETRPQVKPRETRPPVKPGETRPPVKPGGTRPPVKPGETRPSLKPEGTSLPDKPKETRPPVKPMETRPSAKLREIMSAIKLMEKIPPVKPMEKMPPIIPMEIMSAVKPMEKMPAVKPIEKIPPIKASFQVSCDEEVKQVIDQYEKENGVKYRYLSKKTGDFGITHVTSLESRRLLFEQYVPKGADIEYDGVPFIFLYNDILGCALSSRHHMKKGFGIRTQPLSNLSVSCRSKVRLRKIIRFPQYKNEGEDSLMPRLEMCKALMKEFCPETTIQEYRVYITFEGEHENHALCEEIEKLDGMLISYIKDLTKRGKKDVGYVYEQTNTYAHSLIDGKKDFEGFCLNLETLTYHMKIAGQRRVVKSAVQKKVKIMKSTKSELPSEPRPPVKASFQVSSDEEAKQVIDQYEMQNGVKYVTQTVPKTGSTSVTTLESRTIRFENYPSKGAGIEFDGVPFIVVCSNILMCNMGATKQVKLPSDGIHKPVKTLKVNCPAKLRLRRIIRFPQYKDESADSLYARKHIIKTLKKEFCPETTIQEYRIYISFDGEHEKHALGETGNRLDRRVIEYIKKLAKDGCVDTEYVHKQACKFGESLAKGYALSSCKRFQPSKTAIYNHMYTVLDKNRYPEVAESICDDVCDEYEDYTEDSMDTFHIEMPSPPKKRKSAGSNHMSVAMPFLSQNNFSTTDLLWTKPLNSTAGNVTSPRKRPLESTHSRKVNDTGVQYKKSKVHLHNNNDFSHTGDMSSSHLLPNSVPSPSQVEYLKLQNECLKLFQSSQSKVQNKNYSVTTLLAVKKNLENLNNYLDRKRLKKNPLSKKKIQRTRLYQGGKRKKRASKVDTNMIEDEVVSCTTYLTDVELTQNHRYVTATDHAYQGMVVQKKGSVSEVDQIDRYMTVGNEPMTSEVAASVVDELGQYMTQEDGTVLVIQE